MRQLRPFEAWDEDPESRHSIQTDRLRHSEDGCSEFPENCAVRACVAKGWVLILANLKTLLETGRR